MGSMLQKMGNFIKTKLRKNSINQNSRFDKKYKNNILKEFLNRFTIHFKGDEMFKEVINQLITEPGPICIEIGKIVPYENFISTWNYPCVIVIWSELKQTVQNVGLGSYVDRGYILTGSNVLENLDDCKILVFLPNQKNYLIYSAQCIGMIQNHGLAEIKLKGSLEPLRFIKRRTITNKFKINDVIYFYSLSSGDFKIITGKILPRPLDIKDFLDNEFLTSKPGFQIDIGGPVIFKIKHNCQIIGIYRGNYTHQSKTYGRFVIFPDFIFN
ncbi:hypothetical protein E1301_Tti023693 [Triplophysa tibetana]|uniref:Uncharacterized protein n=1 Tax=Triplophysa tibetana TaxID=1572043 RepID=A0A5A9NJC5_9TELE|nr:hypothetical protein E1301_Tti023693 [Triplophysa tibetana]